MNEAMKQYPPRPVLTDEHKLDAVKKWANKYLNLHSVSAQDKDTLIEAVMKKADEYMDGFELGVEINTYFDVNFEIADALDAVAHYLSSKRRELERNWLSKNNIKPPFPVGSKVKWDSGFSENKGVIVNRSQWFIEKYPGCYSIKADDYPDSIFSVEYEDVELIEQATEVIDAN